MRSARERAQISRALRRNLERARLAQNERRGSDEKQTVLRNARPPWRRADAGISVAHAVGMPRLHSTYRRLIDVSIVLALAASPAAAQDEREFGQLLLTRPRLETPEELKRVHEDRAQREWVFGQNLLIAEGFDSNIFESPAAGEGASFVNAGLEVHARRYLTPADRFRARAMVSPTPFFATDRTDIHAQGLESEWRRSLTGRDSFYLPFRLRHENDHVVNSEGESPLRNFEFTSYELEPALRREFSHRHWLFASVLAERRYYPSVAGLDDFDHWRFGPLVRYQRPVAEHRLLEQDLAVLRRVVEVRPDLLDDDRALLVDLPCLESGAAEQKTVFFDGVGDALRHLAAAGIVFINE